MKPENEKPTGKVNYRGVWRDCIILREQELYSIVRIKDPKQFTDNIITAKPNLIRKD